MRKTVAALAALVLLAGAAIAYAQSVTNTYTVTSSTSPTRAGTNAKPVPVGVKFGYKVGEAEGRRPSPVKKYSILFAGLIANTAGFPACSASKIESGGTDACPDGSDVGRGFIENETGATADPNDKSIQCNAALTVYNGGAGKATIYVEGDPNQSDPRRKCAIQLAAPIPAKFVKKSGGTALEFTVPSSLLHPGAATISNAVVSVSSTIDRIVRKGRGFFESTGGCKGGKRKVAVTFTPEQGAAKTVATNAKCSS